MTSSSSNALTGHSGAAYEFAVFPLQGQLPPPVVCYLFEQELQSSGAPLRHAVYIRQSPDAADRSDDRHQQCSLAKRDTHVALRVDYDDGSRAQAVSDMVRALRPVCNG